MQARRRRRGKWGRRGDSHFMDAALDAYIRHLALQKWREVTDLQEALGVDLTQAGREAGSFAERGAYRDIWERWWQSEVVAHITASAMPLFACVETAVQKAMREENHSRRQHGDVLLEDTPAYKTFVDQALDRLFEEEAGSLEEL